MQIKINKNLKFSHNTPPKLIAEVSGNHNGKQNLFYKHILEAKKSGADFVKIQTYEPEDITEKKLNFNIKKGLWKGKSLWNLYKKAHTPFSWHYRAFEIAKKNNINLFITTFSVRALEFLDKFSPKIYKISSFEITDFNLIDQIAKRKKPIILSSGASSYDEIKNAKKLINKYHNNLIILYCVSGYPTPLEEANINIIDKFKKKFNKNLIGLSDHTNTRYSSLSASAKNIAVIEKHFIISKKIRSEDNKFSITPEQFKDLSINSKLIFKSLGEKKFHLKESEKKSIIFRRSIFTTKKIKKGERFSNKNIKSLRPFIGLSSSYYFRLIGKKAKRNYNIHTPLPRKFNNV